MPSEKDDFTGNHCYIQVNPSGGRFHLYGDDPNEIDIDDISNALSKQCRFTGHLQPEFWYSVAEHSVDVSNIVALMGGTLYEQYCGLMHDTPEAYLSDISAPFKRELGSYYEKEALIWSRIAAKFGLHKELPAIVKKADWAALFIEAQHFVVPVETLKEWNGWEEHGEPALALGYKMYGMPHSIARDKFRKRFDNLSQYALIGA